MRIIEGGASPPFFVSGPDGGWWVGSWTLDIRFWILDVGCIESVDAGLFPSTPRCEILETSAAGRGDLDPAIKVRRVARMHYRPQ
jgi:hypothetical protein